MVSEECANSLPSERVNECPATEAKDNQKRFMIETPDDIFEIKAFLLESFDGAQKSLTELWDFGERYQKSVVEHLANGIVI